MKTNRYGLAVLASVALLVGGCSSGGGSNPTTPAQTQSSATSSSNAVTITMVDFSFQPTTVTASTSQAITLVNNGSALHNFTIQGTSVTVDVQPGQSTTLAAPGPSFTPKTYTFFCKYHQSQGMTGTLNATT